LHTYINHKTVRDSYDRLLDRLSGKIDKTRGDVKNMMKHMSIKTVGSAIPRVETSDTPLNPRKEDYPKLKYWTRKPWSAVRRKDVANDSDCPTFSLFMEDEFGSWVSEGMRAAVLNDAASFWLDMISAGEMPKTFGHTGLDRKTEFRTRLEDNFPWLRLCEAHWKVNQVWINYFTRWRNSYNDNLKKTKSNAPPIPDSDSDSIGVIEVETSDSDASTGSKRGRSDIAEMIPSKKHKGKQTEQPASKYGVRSQARPKPTAKIAKVRTSSFLLDGYLLKDT
jgi:hypothetical protein